MQRRFSVLRRLSTLFLALCALRASAVDLRGYGEVTAVRRDGGIAFVCESDARAALLRAKLVRDFQGMGALRATLRAGVLEFPDGRALVVGQKGASVVLRAGRDRAGLDFPELKPYPTWLDFFDLRSLKFYAAPMTSMHGYGLETHWPFARDHHIGGFVYHAFSLDSTPASGVVDFAAMDYELEAARRADGTAVVAATVGAALPLWLYNEGPEKTAKIQTSTVVTEWQSGVCSASYESYGRGFDPRESPIRRFQKQVMDRYRDHPNLGGWQLYRGAPIGDQLGRGMGGVLWDSSPQGRESFKAWLKGKYSLAELGARWHGDAAHFKSWDDVPFCQFMDLIGGDYDTGRALLSMLEWEWSSTPKDAYGTYPAADAKWVKFHFPPSRRLQFLAVDSAYYRLRSLPQKWLKGKTGKTIYLKAVCHGYDHRHLQAWVNGVLFKSPPLYSSGSKMTAIELPPNTLRGDGTDEIVFQTPFGSRGDGRIHGPISLSLAPAENYPYADVRVNARYIDLCDYERDMLKNRNLELFGYARHIDPVRPMSVSGADWNLFARMMSFLTKYGISLQTTSIDAFYWPQLADWGRLHDFYSIAEPSQPLKPGNIDRVLGQQFYMGAGASAIFMDIEQYMKREREEGFMTKRDALFRHFGHYLVEEPKIAHLCTSQTHQMGSSKLSFSWNLALGDYQCAHAPATLITEHDLVCGKVTPEKYPLLFDGSSIMTAETVAAIRRYVEAGGTFVAMAESGRHSDLRENARLLDALTRFTPGDKPRHGKITFSKTQTLFPEWAGRTMDGRGIAAWPFTASLAPQSPDAETIATWADGTTAIGLNRIGKGRVVTLATDFHRVTRFEKMKLLAEREPEVLVALIRQLGVARTATATSPLVWTRLAAAKTGLEDWLIAVNVNEKPPLEKTVDLAFALAERPLDVIDAKTGARVPFTYGDDGMCRLANITFAHDETKIFAAIRPLDVERAMRVWWGEKCKYWRACPPVKTADPEPEAPRTKSLDTWQFSLPGETSARTARIGSWKLQFKDLADYRGEATYRHVFTLPEGWAGKRVKLSFRARRAIHDRAAFAMNGTVFATVDRAKIHPELSGLDAFDVTPFLKAGEPNTLEVKVTGGSTVVAGLADTVFLEVERTLRPEVSLNGAWEGVGGDFVTVKPATLPGRVHARYLRRTFDVPREWKGRKIFLRLETPAINVSAVVINDRGKGLDGAYSPFGNRTEINVTEFLKFGETNTIELWHRHTLPTNYIGVQWNWPKESTLSVGNVVLGPCAETD